VLWMWVVPLRQPGGRVHYAEERVVSTVCQVLLGLKLKRDHMHWYNHVGVGVGVCGCVSEFLPFLPF
jgi:hypothetical protein